MESRIVLAVIVLSALLCGRRLLTQSTDLSASRAAKLSGTSGFLFGLFTLAIGVVNLFFGFKDSQLLWFSFHGNTLKNWLPFEGHEAAYIYTGVLSSGWVLVGAGVLRLWAALPIDKEKDFASSQWVAAAAGFVISAGMAGLSDLTRVWAVVLVVAGFAGPPAIMGLFKTRKLRGREIRASSPAQVLEQHQQRPESNL
ncbi:hypothetical protein [Bradyrhizobium sp. C9]|uniref:hypothetical protein n=1 Tax=Bradyrhizobium sp. C9 TaxID=142585 RepID=UPI0011785386|nr:hypothetical protein [Bradyrhizobium sp. C9]